MIVGAAHLFLALEQAREFQFLTESDDIEYFFCFKSFL